MTPFKFSAIGTQWQIDITDPLSEDQFNSLSNKILDRIEEFDKKYSRFRKDSWVQKISTEKGTTFMPTDAQPLFSLYQRLNTLSRGLFTPLMGKTLEDAGYNSSYTLKPKPVISKPPTLKDAVNWNKKNIKLKKNVLFDFGAAGKGYLVDIVTKLLEGHRICNFTIDAGGDIFYKNTSGDTLKVGLEHPEDSSRVIGIVNILNESVCGSAGNRRKWDKYHHTINPFTLSSPTDIIATWVIADSAMLADGLATCLYLDPHPEHYKDFKFECVLLYKDYSVFVTNNFRGEIFTK